MRVPFFPRTAVTPFPVRVEIALGVIGFIFRMV